MPIEILDIGVIMSSQTNWVFEDMVERYPGAKYFYEDFKGRCECKNPSCPREAMQDNLEHLFGDDKERIALFFAKLAELDSQPSDYVIQAILVQMGIISSTGTERDIVEDRLEEAVRDAFPGMKVIRLN